LQQAYYLDTLVVELAWKLWSKPTTPNPGRLVLGVGLYRQELLLLNLLALQPLEARVICTDKSKAAFSEAKKWLNGASFDRQLDSLSLVGAEFVKKCREWRDGIRSREKLTVDEFSHANGRQLVEELSNWLKGVQPPARAVEISAGLSSMSAAATRIAQRAEIAPLFLYAPTDDQNQNQVQFGAEEIQLLDW